MKKEYNQALTNGLHFLNIDVSLFFLLFSYQHYAISYLHKKQADSHCEKSTLLVDLRKMVFSIQGLGDILCL